MGCFSIAPVSNLQTVRKISKICFETKGYARRKSSTSILLKFSSQIINNPNSFLGNERTDVIVAETNSFIDEEG